MEKHSDDDDLRIVGREQIENKVEKSMNLDVCTKVWIEGIFYFETQVNIIDFWKINIVNYL